MRLKLSSSYREVVIAGKMTIGSVEEGSFMVLDDKGRRLLEKVKNREEINSEGLSNNLKELISVGKEIGIFLEDNEEEKVRGYDIVTSAYVHVTDHCNFHCVGCYSDVAARNEKNELTTAQLMEVFRKLRKAGCESLMISGGEPFLRKDIVDVLKYAKNELGFSSIILGTNGSVHDKEKIAEVSQYVDVLSVSIDGFDYKDCDYIRDKGAFLKTDEFIDLAKEAKAKLRILPTIHKFNYKKVNQYIAYAKKKGVPIAFSLLTCNKKGSNLEKYVLSQEEMREFVKEQNGSNIIVEDSSLNMDSLYFHDTCAAGKSFISVAADGKVYPCHMLQEEEYCLGNVLSDDVLGALNSQNAKRIRDINVDKSEKCSNCDYRYFCGGGCKARQLFQKINDVDMYCRAYLDNFSVIDKMFEEL